jgi:hypothetical protein
LCTASYLIFLDLLLKYLAQKGKAILVPKYYALETYGGSEDIAAFLTSILDGGEWPAS